ncbi:MAG: NAD-binding protein [Christensenellales bacterium]
MNILIVGCGRVGNTLVRSLAREEHDVTVVDEDREVIRSITDSCDVMGFCGNGANGETLLAAGADKADLAIAVTRSDELNMLTCFVQKLGAKRTVARIRGDYYFAKGFDFVKASIEADRVINPELLCAESAYNILRLPSAIKMETFAADKLEVAEFIVRRFAGGGVTLAELKKNRGSNFLICAPDAAAKRLSPKAGRAARRDRICVVSGVSEMGKVIKTLGLVKRTMHSVTIVGASQTALYLARMLSAARVSVKIVEKDPEKRRKRALN